MKSRYLIAAYALIIFCLIGSASPAFSQVTTRLTADLTDVSVGEPVTFTLTNSIFGPLLGPSPGQTSGTFNFYSTAIGAIFSGDGQAQASSFFDQFSETFTYSNPGVFTPYASGTYNIGAGDCDASGCHFVCGICGGGGQFFALGPAVTVSVPEPSTWALMLLGFAGLGFAFRRSRRTEIKHNYFASPGDICVNGGLGK